MFMARKAKNLPKTLEKVTPPNNIGKINTLPYDFYYKDIGFYCENVHQAAFLLQHNWPFHMEYVDKLKFPQKMLNFSMYNIDIPESFYIKKPFARNFIEWIEINTLTNFYPYTKLGIQVSLHKPGIPYDLQRQSNPDVLLDFTKSKYTSLKVFGHRYLGKDLKTSINITQPENNILNITPSYYKEALDNYLLFNEQQSLNLSQIEIWINKLKTSCENRELHLEEFLNGLHNIKKGGYLPPFRVNSSFNEDYLAIDGKKSLTESVAHFNRVIEEFYVKKDFFEGTEIDVIDTISKIIK